MRRTQAGFTVIEMMTTITILAILVAVALPSFGYLAASTKVKGAATELYLAMIRARSEAVKRNRAVAIIAVSGDKDIWHSGWRVIADGNNDGDYVDAATIDRIVYEQGELKRVTIGMATDTVVFRPDGRVSSPAVVEFAIAAEDQDRKTELVRCVETDLTGRPYVKQEAC
jgi:type IV fimbrial biogenesis protein FimT